MVVPMPEGLLLAALAMLIEEAREWEEENAGM